jgi:hypothetical protein
VRKILSILFATAALCVSCSKEHSVKPSNNNVFKVSIIPSVDAITNSTWQQVLGGEALINFTFANTDTLSALPIKDSLNLKNAASYNKQVLAGTYNITLKTESTAVADTFIRFNAQVNNLFINKDQAINFAATTTDGVITISKSMIDTLTVPTFTPTGTSTALNFGSANGYYFIYVADATAGRITFTESTSAYQYMKDLTVSALNQYDLSPILNTTSIAVHLHHFNLKANIQ